MAEELKIHIVCGRCQGTGKVYRSVDSTSPVTPSEEDCYLCEGTGHFEWGRFNNLVPTCKVASCINSTEYLALAEAAKDGVKIVLMCGFVDMREDQWARTTLFTIFGALSTTEANLIAMFG
jgi:DnaJ-class molecular chaperone